MTRLVAAVVAGLIGAACSTGAGPSSPVDPARLAAGEQAFAMHCAECHGEAASGTDEGPTLIDDIYRPAHHADGSISLAISRGVPQHHWNFGPMLPVEGVSEEEVNAIIAYVRHLQAEAGIE